jgi:acyl dehydratase
LPLRERAWLSGQIHDNRTAMLYIEDFTPGDTHLFGSKTVTEDEIIAFATEYDPQYFHIDPVAARDSNFGGLVASGWHSVSMTCRMFIDNLLGDAAVMGGIGADEVRWLKPVRAGDTLSVRATVLEAQRSRSKPDRGSVKIRLETFDAAETSVLTMTVLALIRTRPA